MAKVRSKKCKVCEQEFIPRNSLQKCCSIDCALKYATQDISKKEQKKQKEIERIEKASIRYRKEKLKTKNDLIREAQEAVNRYIRLRDENKNCISCGCPLVRERVGGGFDAGHFRSRGSAPHLRFYTLNIAGQCKKCNRYGGGERDLFKVGLINWLGADKVEQIECDHRPRHYTEDDLRRIKKIFNKKSRLIKKRRGLNAV